MEKKATIDKSAAMEQLRAIERNSKITDAQKFKQAKFVVENAPTIEAEPVRHGRWKKKKGEIYCTNCKKSKWSESFELMLRRFDFCPKCGARMDALKTCCCISDEEAKRILGGADKWTPDATS